jgi:hypothetical protein
MKFSFPALRAGSLRSPARSAGKAGKSETTTTNNQTKSTKFVSGLDPAGHRYNKTQLPWGMLSA